VKISRLSESEEKVSRSEEQDFYRFDSGVPSPPDDTLGRWQARAARFTLR
jgi:hypothetical protein